MSLDIPYSQFLDIKARLIIKDVVVNPSIEFISNYNTYFAYTIELTGNTVGEVLSKAQEYNRSINNKIYEAIAQVPDLMLAKLTSEGEISNKKTQAKPSDFYGFDKDKYENTLVRVNGRRVHMNISLPVQNWFAYIKPEWFMAIKEKMLLTHQELEPVIDEIDYMKKSLLYSILASSGTEEEKSMAALDFNSAINKRIIDESWNVYEYLGQILGIQLSEDIVNSLPKPLEPSAQN